MHANYGSKVSNDTTFIKQFNNGIPSNLWKTFHNFGVNPSIPVITTASELYQNLYIPGNIYIDGSVLNLSDQYVKSNIMDLTKEQTNKIMDLKVSQFTLNKDNTNKIHYGFISQEVENSFPELIYEKPDINMSNLKSINYLEIIPLLVSKIQLMQKEIDELRLELLNITNV